MQTYATKQRKRLLAFLEEHPDELFSVKEIAAALAPEGVSLSAVYRNVADMEEEGKLTRITRDGARTVLYRYADDEECKKHLHLSCFRCGKTYHMEEPVTDELIRAVAKSSDFDVDSQSTVLYGICRDCKRRQDPGKSARPEAASGRRERPKD
ncbi:MAG: transcriptional repressor [Clostridia bacterium]|nr:transcriptional repressor [Clostridia bacterium]